MDSQTREPYRVKVDQVGRIVIPAELRAKLGIACGDELILFDEEENGMRVETFRHAVRRAQDYFARLADPSVSMVDELIRERREEAAREELE